MTEVSNISPLHQLIAKGRRIKLAKGESLPSSDEKQNVILVERGYIKRFLISNQGNLGVQIIYGPGNVFPLSLAYRSLLGQSIYDGPETYHHKAMTDSIVYALEPALLHATAKNNPEVFYKYLFSEAGDHLATSVQRLENMALRSSYKRVAHILLFYSDKFGKELADGIHIQVPLTHQDIADILNVSRETVSVCMVALSKKGIIKTGRQIVVPNQKKLAQEAYG